MSCSSLKVVNALLQWAINLSTPSRASTCLELGPSIVMHVALKNCEPYLSPKSQPYPFPSSNFWTALIKRKAGPEDPRSSFELHRLPKWLTSNQTLKMPKPPFLSRVQPLMDVKMFFLLTQNKQFSEHVREREEFANLLFTWSPFSHGWFRPLKTPKNTMKTLKIVAKRLKFVLTAKIGN